MRLLFGVKSAKWFRSFNNFWRKRPKRNLLLLLLLFWFISHALWNEPDRLMRDPALRFPSTQYSQLEHPGSKAVYPSIYTLQNNSSGIPVSYTLSCIEFNEQGDFLSTAEVDHTESLVAEAARRGGVLLVYYIPGWQSNAISGDFASFNYFVEHIAQDLPTVTSNDPRQHWTIIGVYLSWRGTTWQPKQTVKPQLRQYPGGACDLDIDQHRFSGLMLSGFQTLGFWSRQAAADRFASGPLSETVWRLSHAARQSRRSQIILLGYSMGGNILERTLMQTVPSDISQDTNNSQRWYITPVADLVLLLESAAPAAYMRRLQDFFARYSATAENNRPWVISVSSSADLATTLAFPLAQTIRSGIALNTPREEYVKTGCNVDYMRSHFVKAGELTDLTTKATCDSRFTIELGQVPLNTAAGDPISTGTLVGNEFLAWDGWGDGRWYGFTSKGRIFDLVPLKGNQVTEKASSVCWVIRVPHSIIANHGDIWSANSMNLMMALYRMSGLSANVLNDSVPPRRIWLHDPIGGDAPGMP